MLPSMYYETLDELKENMQYEIADIKNAKIQKMKYDKIIAKYTVKANGSNMEEAEEAKIILKSIISDRNLIVRDLRETGLDVKRRRERIAWLESDDPEAKEQLAYLNFINSD